MIPQTRGAVIMPWIFNAVVWVRLKAPSTFSLRHSNKPEMQWEATTLLHSTY